MKNLPEDLMVDKKYLVKIDDEVHTIYCDCNGSWYTTKNIRVWDGEVSKVFNEEDDPEYFL